MSAEGLGPEGNWTDFKSLSFKLYYYKVLPCTKPFSHDWQHCPFTHPNDKARRRSPLQHPYAADMCPAMLQSGKCPKGVNCNLAHNLFEYHLHPDRYKTKMCRDGSRCRRVFCFFAHTPAELRVPFLATTAEAAAAAQQQVGGGNGSSSSSSTSVKQPATPSSSPGHGRALDTMTQQLAAALDSASMGGSSTNSAEIILGALSGSGSIGPAVRQAFYASPVHQVHGHHATSSSMHCPMPGSSNSSSSSSRLSHMQQYNGFVAGASQQQLQQQPGVFAGSACDAAAANQQQQGQACYSVWDHLQSQNMYCTAAARAGRVLGVDGSNAVFDAQTLLPLGATSQATDAVISTSANVITPLALPAASSTLPWAVQAVNSAPVNFISPGSVNSGLKCATPGAINMEMFASSMSGTHYVADSSSCVGAQHIRLMHPGGRPNNAAAAAAAAGGAAPTVALAQQQQQQQPLQLLLQSGNATPHMLTQEVYSTSGQYNTALLPATLLTATSAATGGAAVQCRTVLPAVPLSMPGQQQQQRIVSHTAAAGSTAAVGATVLPMPQWLS